MMINLVRAVSYKFVMAFSGLTLLMALAQPATAHAANDVTRYSEPSNLLSVSLITSSSIVLFAYCKYFAKRKINN
jgi:uncharacterized membrane protein